MTNGQFKRQKDRQTDRQADRQAGRGLTAAVSEVSGSYGMPQEAGGPPQVTGAGVGHVVVATYWLLSRHGDGAGRGAAHDAVSTVGLVSYTAVCSWTHHVGA